MSVKLDFTLDSMPKWVTWVAQDANGKWWGYEIEPLIHDNGWYENESGRYILLNTSASSPTWKINIIKIK
ncbi:MAG: hypothetical protein GXP13_00640 [Gammaproteobacteria bacterium]|nr:hypothetical protein [Gammaproteobacteria bacterium]